MNCKGLTIIAERCGNMSNKKNTIFTCGYGNNKPEAFLARLKDARITHVLDVRRKESSARLFVYRWGKPIHDWLECAGIDYTNEAGLYGNYFKQDVNFRDYSTHLKSQKIARHLAHDLMSAVYPEDAKLCLVCCEKKPFQEREISNAVYAIPNCHRVILAEAVIVELKPFNEEWEVVHL